MNPAQIQEQFGVHKDIIGGGWLDLAPGQVTDDTEMTLCIARSIAAKGEWDLVGIADRFALWFEKNPVDVGDTCRRGIERYRAMRQLQVPPGKNDAGNGAAMRIAPVALFSLGNEERMARLAVEQARLTHNHPLSDAACVAVGILVQRGILGYPERMLRAAADGLVGRHPEFWFEEYDGGATAYVVDTMRTVLDAFFTTDCFEECLVKIVNRGDDADTTAAIAGAIAGARYGLEAIPSRWLAALDPALRDELSLLALRLVDLSPLFSGKRES
jgi:ADP-ribosyl-[dinitrogen reductase] hydrolase